MGWGVRTDLRDRDTGLLAPGPDREDCLLEFSSGASECPSCSKFLHLHGNSASSRIIYLSWGIKVVQQIFADVHGGTG